MNLVLVSILIFVVTLGAAVLGLFVHQRLPPEEKNESARSIVGQVAGLVSILLAIVLGTLIGTSFGFFGGQKTALEGLSAQILELDQALAQYGPETKPARDRLKEAAQHAYDAFWGGGEVDPKILTVADPMAGWQATKAFLGTLNPTTEAQKQAVASANTLANQIEHGRILMNLQVASQPVSAGLIIVLVVWAVVLFFAMGLFAESNRVVVAALVFGALCVGFAIFLILELGQPYTGLFRVSPAALQEAIANIDK
ncbi:MAG: hypothetical protein JO288_23475 [Hyphomicrobiales bacterium]|nr:hypothetical protein [Hyphomicrobiales bacterium]